MATIAGCRALINQYQSLRNNVLNVSASIDSSSSSILNVYNRLRDAYNVNDDVTPITMRSYQLSVDTEKTSNYLKNTVVPEIDEEIARLRREIARLEEEERRRREEARRRAASAKKTSTGLKPGASKGVARATLR